MEKISKFQNYLKPCKLNSLETPRQNIWLQRSPRSGSPPPPAPEALSTKSRSSLMTSIKRKWNTATIGSTSKRIICLPSHLFLICQNLTPWNKKATFSGKAKAQEAWESCQLIRAYQMCWHSRLEDPMWWCRWGQCLLNQALFRSTPLCLVVLIQCHWRKKAVCWVENVNSNNK